MERLLDTLTIVETSRGVAVRFCGRLFAQMGATVIRAPGGDDAAIGYAGEAGRAYGRWLDAGKLDALPDGPVDLVIAGQDAAGVAAGEAAAASLPGEPSLLALRWFHPDGPYADWRGTDEILQALAGMAYGFGPIEGPPTLAQGHGPQITAGLASFNAALAALMARPRPKRIDANIFEAYVFLLETGAVSTLIEGGVMARLGVNRMVPVYPAASYRTADGWAGVTALTPAQWAGFCGIIGRPGLASDARFTTTVERLLLADEVDAACAPPFLDKTTEQWVALGESVRAPITAMPNLAELPHVPHWRARGAFGPFDDSGALAPTLPYRMTFGGSPRPVQGSGPDAPPQRAEGGRFFDGLGGAALRPHAGRPGRRGGQDRVDPPSRLVARLGDGSRRRPAVARGQVQLHLHEPQQARHRAGPDQGRGARPRQGADRRRRCGGGELRRRHHGPPGPRPRCAACAEPEPDHRLYAGVRQRRTALGHPRLRLHGRAGVRPAVRQRP
nr:CoA transferase [uncultured Phenylobacterium sp.]